MVKMEICFDLEDQQTSKMNEAFLLAYKVRKAGRGVCLGFGKFKPSSVGGAKAFPPKSKKVAFGSVSPSASPTRCSSEAPVASNPFPPENLLSSGKEVDAEPEDPAATSELQRRQPPGGSVQAITTTRSDGEPSEERPQRSSPPSRHREAPLQLAKEATGAPGSSLQA
jgi:hypothetical protein